MKIVDYLIVGQGLAGSLLAMRLLADGQTVMVLDNAHNGAASSVAAGLINPITGHRLNLTQGFAEFMPTAEREYARLTTLLKGPKFLQHIQQHRLIKNSGQANYLERRRNDSGYAQYLTPITGTKCVNNHPLIDRGFGIVSVEKTGVVDSQSLLGSVATYLHSSHSLQIEKFDYAQLRGTSADIRYKDIVANAVLFCEGYQAIHNPWLKSLPFKLAKGDVLNVQVKHLNEQQPADSIELLNWGSWLLTDSSGGSAKLGSSYDWNNLDTTPDPTNANKLIASANGNIHSKLEIIEHRVGIRPTTTHRQPFIGALSSLDRAYCFNGFGSKGCLLIPHYAQQMSEHLRLGKPLHKELNQWL